MFALRSSAPVRAVSCRCEPSGATVATVAKPEEVKIQSTLSSLDALLGEQAKPQAKQEKPSPAPAQAAPPSSSQSGVFSWPGGSPAQASSSQPVNRPAAATKTKAATFESTMGFEGLAPEVINGRVAMLGFLAGISREFGNGESIYSQVVSGGAGQAALVIAAVVLASFAPALRQVPMAEIFNKVPKKMRGLGPFAADAEMLNGRAAMVGLAVILILEGTSGTAFFL